MSSDTGHVASALLLLLYLDTETSRIGVLNLHLLGFPSSKCCFPETPPSRRKWSFRAPASTRRYLGFSTLAFSCKARSSPALSTHWTRKHAFSLTELSATLNLNSEVHKRRVCFNSCFHNRALKSQLSRQLVLLASLFTVLFIPMPSCQATLTAILPAHTPESQENANYWMQGHPKQGPLTCTQRIFLLNLCSYVYWLAYY